MKQKSTGSNRTGLVAALIVGMIVVIAAVVLALTRQQAYLPTGGSSGTPVAGKGAPAKMAEGWDRGQVVDVEGFRLVVLKPQKVMYGAGPGILAGPIDCAEPDYWALRTKPMKGEDDAGPSNIFKFYKVDGETLEATTETVFPDGYRDIPLLAWQDGRTLSLTDQMGKDGLAKAPGPVGHSYTLVAPQGKFVMQQDHFFYTSDEPMGFFPVLFPGLIQVFFRIDAPPPGPFPVEPWICPSNTSGHSLPRIQALATGNSWRGSQRINVVVDDHGQFFFNNTAGTDLEVDPRWQAVGDVLRKADSPLRQISVADNFAAFDTKEGIQLVGLDGMQHLIPVATSAPAQNAADTSGSADPVANSCGPLTRIRALDATTLILMDSAFNRLTLVRRSARKL